jgi:formamidopyrimidine-DNA glycosylase
MPELPEVETVRLGLEPVLRGRRFVRVELRRPDLRFPLPERFAERLAGRRVRRLDRRAKYILVHLDRSEVLAIHLGMTGRFVVSRGGAKRRRTLGEYTYEHAKDAKHDHIVFTMSNGASVIYNDARRFGYMTLIADDELAHNAFFEGLGVEPLGSGLTAAYVAGRARGRRTDLKAFLMDQRMIAGLGNIYVCEALFRARLDPRSPVSRLVTKVGEPTQPAHRIVVAIKSVLEDAICAGGSTLRDYKQANGEMGAFQNSFQVYGREGEPCLRAGCRGTVRRSTQGGRSTFYCPVCQR